MRERQKKVEGQSFSEMRDSETDRAFERFWDREREEDNDWERE